MIVRFGNTVGSGTRHSDGTEGDRADWSYSKREITMPQPSTPVAGEQVRRDRTTLAVRPTKQSMGWTPRQRRYATLPKTPSGTDPEDVEKNAGL